MEKEYTVIANTREDLPALEAEITASSGAGPIPDRSVDIANPRPGSRIQTHFMLTDEEAEELRNDPRVRAVEIPPEQRDDISIGLNAYQFDGGDFEFYRGSGADTNRLNWGLKRCIKETNEFVSGSSRTTASAGNYEYAIDGTGVDVVIQDSGIEPNHPEWEDADGNSRLQQINWYTASGLSGTQSANHYRDYDGHGTHCAGIAAGKLYGWAKGAHIYSQKLSGLEGPGDSGTGISISDAFDCIRLWHNAKTNGRPTVVNMSWGYGATISTDPTSGVYRGTAWTYGVDYTTRGALEDATGVSEDRFIDAGNNTFFRQATRVASVDAEVEDMIDDGIHICIAAGNNYNKIDITTGADYNNTVVFNSTTYNYHRGSSPYSDNCFMVGNIDSGFSQYVSETYSAADILKDQTASSSSRGPAVNIWAPGTNIMSACSTINDGYTTTTHPEDETYLVMSIGGTSMAAPQVAGVVAQHLQVKPDLTPAQMMDRIIGDSQAVVYSTGSATDYGRILDSVMGSPNRMLYSRYGKQAVTTNVAGIVHNISVT